MVVAQEGLLGVDHQEAHDVVADAGEALYLGLGDARRRDEPEALPVGLLFGHVVAPALGGGVHEDELLIVRSDEVDAVRAVRPALLQDLDVSVPQVRSDCLVSTTPASWTRPSRTTSKRSSAPWRTSRDRPCGCSGAARNRKDKPKNKNARPFIRGAGAS